MKRKYSEFKIGGAVLLAIVIFVMTIIWGKGYSLIAKSRLLNVEFEDIGGLEQGAFVLVNGMRKGKVLEFVLQQEGVVVRCALEESVQLYDDARFEITATELMGSKVVNIYPGISGRDPAAGIVFRGESGGGMNQLMKMSSHLAQDVQRLLGVLETTITSINKTAGDPRVQEAFISSVKNLDASSQATLELIRLNEGKLTQVMDNLVATTGSIRGLVETNAEDVSHAIGDAHGLITQLSEISTGLKRIVDMAQGSEGTLGMLINDKKFADDLSRTLAGVDSLVTQIREDGIQTNISLFGKKKKK